MRNSRVVWVGAPVAISMDALSYLLGAAGLSSIRQHEELPQKKTGQVNLLAEIAEGLKLIFHHSMLRVMALEAATFNGASQAFSTLFVLYATRELHLGADKLGLIFGAGGVGALVGSLLAGPLAHRWGFGRALVSTAAVACLPLLLVPATHDSSPLTLAMLMTAYFLEGIGVAASSIHFLSLRQALSPAHLLGRMTASYRTLTYGILPLGALLFGFLGQRIGVHTTLWIGAIFISVAWLWVRFSPVWKLQNLPISDEEG